MESTYLVAGVALAIFAALFAWFEVQNSKREIQRHKDAAVNYRRFVTQQKDELVDAIVERLRLRDAAIWPIGMDLGAFNRIVDLYDRAEMRAYELPVIAHDEHNISFTRLAGDFANRELFVLWLEGIIEANKVVYK